MKSFRLIGFSTVAMVTMGALVLGACGDDTEVVTLDGGGGTDGTVAPDTSRIDATTDSPSNDSGVDAPVDAPFVDIDSGLKLDTFAARVADAMCNTLARCCYGDAKLDGGAPIDGGGTYNRGACLSVFDGVGYEGSLVGFQGSASKTSINQTQGADCLKRIEALTCNLGGVEFQAARAACFGALVGKQAAGQPCARSVDCAPGNFCNAPAGGAGTCNALAAANGDCSSFNTGDENKDLALADEICSYRASGAPKLFCDSIDLANGVKPRAEWKCAAAKINGQDCANSLWCSDGLCNPDTLTCTTPLGVFPQTFCSTFVNP